MLRLDVIHPGISGNKWYKLKYNIEEALRSGNDAILTFGGAYSNHIHATAIAASQAGLRCFGVIRGEQVEPLNPTLKDATQYGMKLNFISRTEYKEKDEESYLAQLKEKFGDFYLVPEGGTNDLAIKGTSEILEEIPIDFDHLVTSVGTGGTIAGLICGLKGKKKVVGIPVLKGGFSGAEVRQLVADYSGMDFENWQMINSYHFGGYAKYNMELVEFINRFRDIQDIPLDPVYTGKMMFGLYDLVKEDYFKPGSSLIVLHTGGLQGIRGFNQRFGNLIH